MSKRPRLSRTSPTYSARGRASGSPRSGSSVRSGRLRTTSRREERSGGTCWSATTVRSAPRARETAPRAHTLATLPADALRPGTIVEQRDVVLVHVDGEPAAVCDQPERARRRDQVRVERDQHPAPGLRRKRQCRDAAAGDAARPDRPERGLGRRVLGAAPGYHLDPQPGPAQRGAVPVQPGVGDVVAGAEDRHVDLGAGHLRSPPSAWSRPACPRRRPRSRPPPSASPAAHPGTPGTPR